MDQRGDENHGTASGDPACQQCRQIMKTVDNAVQYIMRLIIGTLLTSPVIDAVVQTLSLNLQAGERNETWGVTHQNDTWAEETATGGYFLILCQAIVLATLLLCLEALLTIRGHNIYGRVKQFWEDHQGRILAAISILIAKESAATAVGGIIFASCDAIFTADLIVWGLKLGVLGLILVAGVICKIATHRCPSRCRRNRKVAMAFRFIADVGWGLSLESVASAVAISFATGIFCPETSTYLCIALGAAGIIASDLVLYAKCDRGILHHFTKGSNTDNTGGALADGRDLEMRDVPGGDGRAGNYPSDV